MSSLKSLYERIPFRWRKINQTHLGAAVVIICSLRYFQTQHRDETDAKWAEINARRKEERRQEREAASAAAEATAAASATRS